jgi:hypothetical protein
MQLIRRGREWICGKIILTSGNRSPTVFSESIDSETRETKMEVGTPNQAEYLSARLPADLVRMARMVAGATDETVGVVIDAAARATITRRYKQTVEKLTRDLGGEG